MSSKLSMASSSGSTRKTPLIAVLLMIVGYVVYNHSSSTPLFNYLNEAQSEPGFNSEGKVYCEIVDKVIPTEDQELPSSDYFKSDEYRNFSLSVWGDSVRIYTPSFDDMGEVGEDKRWDVFYPFARFLEKSFPNVYAKAKVDKINTHALVYTIEGSNPDLKPILLTGHQDVVPVLEDTIDLWTYPPFEGHFDGEFLYGRGTGDCKTILIGILEAVEFLLKNDFKPKRTIVLAFGFDEEVSGHRGAANIAPFLEKKFGKDSFVALLDEGGLMVQNLYGSKFALVSTGEKGYVDITVELSTTGGHSSIPPKHTGIGIASHLVTLIEKHDYGLKISEGNPFFYQLQCLADNAKSLPKSIKSDITNVLDPEAQARLFPSLAQNPFMNALLTTTSAVDIFNGGLKINALPEKVTVKINHRVSYEDSVSKVKETITSLVKEISGIYGTGITAFGEEVLESQGGGFFNITSTSDLEPAPLTQTVGNPVWDVFGGTIRYIFEDYSYVADGSSVVVSPASQTGNTDTKYYWNLTSNIFRFFPLRNESIMNYHTVDEKVSLDGHIESVAFYYELIKNFDNADF